MSYPTELAPTVTLLYPGEGLGERADTALRQLEAHGMAAGLGLTEHHLAAVGDMATQDSIAEWCPNDINRFGTIAAASKWIAKGGGRGMVGIYSTSGPDGPSAESLAEVSTDNTALAMLAYGWSGHEHNAAIPGADITTAYRVGRLGQLMAHKSQELLGKRFGLGMPLGELVLASAVKHGARAADIALETWYTNTRARSLYSRLGFVPKFLDDPEPRPTLYQPGEIVGQQTVELRTIGTGDTARTVPTLMDQRAHYVLENHPLVTGRAA